MLCLSGHCVRSNSRAAAGDLVFDLVRTAPAGLKLVALNGNLAAASASLENLDAAMAHLTALTSLQLSHIKARNVPRPQHAVLRLTNLEKLTLAAMDTTDEACPWSACGSILPACCVSLVPLLRQAHAAPAHDSSSLLVSFCPLHQHCINRDLRARRCCSICAPCPCGPTWRA